MHADFVPSGRFTWKRASEPPLVKTVLGRWVTPVTLIPLESPLGTKVS